MAFPEMAVPELSTEEAEVATDEVPKEITLETMMQRVADEAELSLQEIDEIRRTVKLPAGWEISKPCPHFAETHVIDSAFAGAAGDRNEDHVPGDVRFYIRPKQLLDSNGGAIPFFRIVQNRQQGIVPRTDIIPSINLFVVDLAYEFRASYLIYRDEDEDDEDDDEDEDAIDCSCGSEIPSEAKFCADCGKPARRCKSCSTAITPGNRFCGGCGLQIPNAAMLD